MRRALALLALLGLLAAPAALAEEPAQPAPIEEAAPSGQGRILTFAAALNMDRVGLEASLYEPLPFIGNLFGEDVTVTGITTARLRVVDPFTEARLQATVVAGVGLQSCATPGVCWSADLRYNVLWTVGEPLQHGPDLTVAVSIGLVDREPGEARVPAEPP